MTDCYAMQHTVHINSDQAWQVAAPYNCHETETGALHTNELQQSAGHLMDQRVQAVACLGCSPELHITEPCGHCEQWLAPVEHLGCLQEEVVVPHCSGELLPQVHLHAFEPLARFDCCLRHRL